jgi:hypothetical protein
LVLALVLVPVLVQVLVEVEAAAVVVPLELASEHEDLHPYQELASNHKE